MVNPPVKKTTKTSSSKAEKKVKVAVTPKAVTPKAVTPKAVTPKSVTTETTTFKTPSVKKVDSKKVQAKVTPPVKKLPALKPCLAKDLPQQHFAVEVNTRAIHRVVVADRSARRQGTHHVKNRSMVAGGGKKPWRQKGTGRARAGSLSSPIFKGGGVVFGPSKNRNYNQKINKKVRRIAFCSALTLKAQSKQVFLQKLALEKPSTKKLLSLLQTPVRKAHKNRILVVDKNPSVFKSSANVPHVRCCPVKNLSVEKILWSNRIVFTPESLAELRKRRV